MWISCNQTEDEEEKKNLTFLDLFDLEEIWLMHSGALCKPLILFPPFSYSDQQSKSCHTLLLTHLQETMIASMKDAIW